MESIEEKASLHIFNTYNEHSWNKTNISLIKIMTDFAKAELEAKEQETKNYIMSDENKISDQIDGGLNEKDRLINLLQAKDKEIERLKGYFTKGEIELQKENKELKELLKIERTNKNDSPF